MSLETKKVRYQRKCSVSFFFFLWFPFLEKCFEMRFPLPFSCVFLASSQELIAQLGKTFWDCSMQ